MPFADKLAPVLGQPILFENQVGSGANVGSELVAKATPNCHTVWQVTVAQSISDTLCATLG